MTTKSQVITVLRRKDNVGMHAIGRALVHLYNRQTVTEQRTESTSVNNGVGFNKGDAKRGVSMAKQYLRTGSLSKYQVMYWQGDNYGRLGRPRIEKYWRQILEEAEKKALRKDMSKN